MAKAVSPLLKLFTLIFNQSSDGAIRVHVGHELENIYTGHPDVVVSDSRGWLQSAKESLTGLSLRLQSSTLQSWKL